MLAVLGAVPVEDRHAHLAVQPRGLLDAEAGLPGLGVAKHGRAPAKS